MASFAGFTAGTTPADNDVTVGLIAAGGAGSDRKWTFSQVWAYIQSKIFAVVYGVPVGIPWLTTITTVSGAGATSLEYIPTLALTATAGGVVAVQFINSATGHMQTWVLMFSTNATDSTHQRPLDFNGSTNQKVWYLVTAA